MGWIGAIVEGGEKSLVNVWRGRQLAEDVGHREVGRLIILLYLVSVDGDWNWNSVPWFDLCVSFALFYNYL